MNRETARQIAVELDTARLDAAPIEPVTSRYPDATPDDAYEIQRQGIALRTGRGARIAGRKIGLSSVAMQQMLGVDEPDFGHLLDEMVVDTGATLNTARLCQPRVEFEVAFVMGRPLPQSGCNVADVARCTEFVASAIEVIDSRIAAWNIKLVDTIADNASSSHIVLSPHMVKPQGLDLATLGVNARINGELVGTGAAGAVLGHPSVAVAWLARKLGSYGVEVGEGEIVLPGSCTRAFDVAANDYVECLFDQLGPVSVRFEQKEEQR